MPARHEKPICGLTGTKNFVLANAVENMLAEPKVRQSSEVDWLRKEDFGKVPQYLTSVKEQVNKEYEMVRTAQLQHTQTHGGGAKMRLLSEEERVEVCHFYHPVSNRLVTTCISTECVFRICPQYLDHEFTSPLVFPTFSLHSSWTHSRRSGSR